ATSSLIIFIYSFVFFFKQKTAYEIGLGIPAEPLFRSRKARVSYKVWIATDRSRARRCVEACVYGTLDFVGYPRFPAPVEFIAAVIAYYVHPVNIQTACLIMEGAEIGRASCRERGKRAGARGGVLMEASVNKRPVAHTHAHAATS